MPAKKTPKPTRARAAKPRAQVESEFQDTVDTVRSREPLTAKDQAAADAHRAQTRAAVEGLSADTVVEKVTRVNLEISRTLQGVQERLLNETNELEKVRAAKADLEQELEELHGKDRVISAIDVLIAEHEERQAALQKEEEEQRQRLTDIEAEFNVRQKELEADTQKKRQRDEADYQYTTTQRRKAEDDAFREKLRVHAIQEQDRREALAKEWTGRDEALKLKEVEFATLIAKVAAFPKELEEAVAKANKATAEAISREYKHAAALAVKDADAAKQLSDSTIANLTRTIETQKADIQQLATRLSQADQMVKSIAEKALESASGTRTLAEVTQFARDNGTGQPRSKS